MVDIALLCTQTSPTVRPAMSRVVSMLVGDIEVSTVTTRPGYLTDWKYNDESITTETSSLSMEAEKNGQPNMPLSSTTTTTTGCPSLEVAAQPSPSEIIGEGR